MLIDKVDITVKAGNGGDGAVAFSKNEGNPLGGPSGGNGGKGADVYLIGVDDLSALSQFQYKKKIFGDDGVSGKRKNLFGKNAKDLFLKIPIGTRVTIGGHDVWEVVDTTTPFLLAQGGKGGRGNNEFKSSTNQSPREFEYGEQGQEKLVTLELRLIAKVGLIGLPNAGKSTLLSLLTNAQPKIGNYPFTTLEPNIGMMDKIMIADIPGLIEGASSGKGLGTKFLKHIEKTELLIHCIDSSSTDPVSAYKIIRNELKNFSTTLIDKKEIIVITKADLVGKKETESIKDTLKMVSSNTIHIVSFQDDESLDILRGIISSSI